MFVCLFVCLFVCFYINTNDVYTFLAGPPLLRPRQKKITGQPWNQCPETQEILIYYKLGGMQLPVSPFIL